MTNMLCARLGKELSIESTVNVGTTFTFAVKSDPEASATHLRPPFPFEKARSFGPRHSLLSLGSEKSQGCRAKERVPPLGLQKSQQHHPDPILHVCEDKPKLKPEEHFDELETATQEFVAMKDINSVRPFLLNHMVGGFSARGTTPEGLPHSMGGKTLTPTPRLSPGAGLPECKREPDQDKPRLIKLERCELSPSSSLVEIPASPEGHPSSLRCGSPRCVSFLPGKDIADNHRFLRALVESNPAETNPPSRCMTQRRVYEQAMTYINHPCKCPIVLIVDDTEINKIVLSGMLSRLGVLHIEASNGLEAVEVLKEHNGGKKCQCAGLKLVLMDCGMPVMNGFEATQEIKRMIGEKEIAPTTVVAVTAYEGSSVEQECQESGMADFINKPVTIERLVQCLHEFLEA